MFHFHTLNCIFCHFSKHWAASCIWFLLFFRVVFTRYTSQGCIRFLEFSSTESA